MATRIRTEWATEYVKAPGSYSFPTTEAEAREVAAAYPQYRRLVRRKVTITDWEGVS